MFDRLTTPTASSTPLAQSKAPIDNQVFVNLTKNQFAFAAYLEIDHNLCSGNFGII